MLKERGKELGEAAGVFILGFNLICLIGAKVEHKGEGREKENKGSRESKSRKKPKT